MMLRTGRSATREQNTVVLLIHAGEDHHDIQIVERLRQEFLKSYLVEVVHANPKWQDSTQWEAALAPVTRILVVISPALFAVEWRSKLIKMALDLQSPRHSRRNYAVVTEKRTAIPFLNRTPRRRPAKTLFKFVVTETRAFDPHTLSTSALDCYNDLMRLQSIRFYDQSASPAESFDELFARKLIELNNAFNPSSTNFGFISHSTAQNDLVRGLKEQFEHAQKTVWVDLRNIPPARDFLEEIYLGILSGNYFFFLMTPQAIASPWCYDEFQYAQGLHKRIIPLRLPPPDAGTPEEQYRLEAADLELLVEARKRNGVSERKLELAEVRQFFLDLYAFQPLELELNPSLPHLVTADCLQRIVTRAQQQNQRDDPAAEDHTRYLVLADNWRQEEGERLSGGDLRHALDWQRQRDATLRSLAPTEYVPYRPAPIHREFIAISLGQRTASRVRLIGLLLLALLVTAIIFVVQDTNTRLSAQQILNGETNRRLQTLAQLNRRIIAPIGGDPVVEPFASTLTASDLWVSNSNGTLMAIALNSGDQNGALLSIGAQPTQTVNHAPYLWMVSREANGSRVQFVRVDTRDHSVITLPIPIRGTDILLPLQPYLAGAWVWLLPNPQLLIGVPAVGSSADQIIMLPISPDAFGRTTTTVVAGEQALWIANSHGNNVIPQDGSLVYIDTVCLQTQALDPCVQTMPVPQLHLVAGALHDGSLWTTEGDQLVRWNAEGTKATVAPLTHPITVLQANDDGLWALALTDAHTTVLNLDALNGTVRRRWQIAGSVNSLHLVDEQAYLYGSDETLTLLSPMREEPLLSTPIVGLNRAPAPLAAGNMVWIIQSTTNSVTVLAQQSGQIIHDSLFACENPIQPAFDGANVWLLCNGLAASQQQVIALPNNLLYVGEDRPILDYFGHNPIEIGDQLWLLQEDSSQILRVQVSPQMQLESTSDYALPVSLMGSGNWMPLQFDGVYLWTAIDNPGKVVRLTPNAALDQAPISDVQSFDIGGEIQIIHLIGDHVLVSYNTLEALNLDIPNLLVVDRATAQARSLQVGGQGDMITGVIPIEDTLWIGAGSLEQGKLFQMDATTLELRQISLPPELARFVPFSGFAYAGRYWFTFGTGALNQTFADLPLDGTQTEITSSYLAAYDPQSGMWAAPHEVPGFTYRPFIDPVPAGQIETARLWYTLSLQPLSLIRSIVVNNSNSRIYALDIPSFTPVLTEALDCTALNSLNIYGKYVWYGCLSGDSVYAFPRAGGTPLIFPNIGRDPTTPLLVDNILVMTFNETGTAALFDTDTGQLLSRVRIGPSPSSPVRYQGHIWAYNSSDGTLQQIMK